MIKAWEDSPGNKASMSPHVYILIYNVLSTCLSRAMLVKSHHHCSAATIKVTYFTQFANIAYIQRLIPPHSRRVSPTCLHISVLSHLHAGENQEVLSFLIRVQQRSKSPTSHSLQTLPTFKGSYLRTQEGCHQHVYIFLY